MVLETGVAEEPQQRGLILFPERSRPARPFRERYEARTEAENDYAQQNALIALGWAVLRFTWGQLVEDGPSVAKEIRLLLRARSAKCRQRALEE